MAWPILAAAAILHLQAGLYGADEPAHLEFRILANQKHDGAAAAKAMAAEGLEHSPEDYRWVWLGQAVTGTDARIESKRVIVPGARWKENEFSGKRVRLIGKNLAGSDLTRDSEIAGNSGNALVLREDPSLFLRSVSSFRIDLTPSGLAPFAEDVPHGLFIREVPEGPGRVKRLVLVELDRHNVTEKDLARVEPAQDERLRPAVRFDFSREGARKLGALTREHLPEDGDAFKYYLGIILDGRLLSAPMINTEVRDAGILELGRDARPEEAERIIRILRKSREQ
jgi:SecD/SecF fusion protein